MGQPNLTPETAPRHAEGYRDVQPYQLFNLAQQLGLLETSVQKVAWGKLTNDHKVTEIVRALSPEGAGAPGDPDRAYRDAEPETAHAATAPREDGRARRGRPPNGARRAGQARAPSSEDRRPMDAVHDGAVSPAPASALEELVDMVDGRVETVRHAVEHVHRRLDLVEDMAHLAVALVAMSLEPRAGAPREELLAQAMAHASQLPALLEHLASREPPRFQGPPAPEPSQGGWRGLASEPPHDSGRSPSSFEHHPRPYPRAPEHGGRAARDYEHAFQANMQHGRRY